MARRTVNASINCSQNPCQVVALADNQRVIVACDSGPNSGTILAIDGGSAQVLAAAATEPLSPVAYTHLRAHETKADVVCRLSRVQQTATL